MEVCKVRSNQNVATFIKELILELPEGEQVDFKFRAVTSRLSARRTRQSTTKTLTFEEEYHPDWDKFDVWRFVSKVDEPVVRAYSMANYPGERGIIMLNVRVASPPPRMPDAFAASGARCPATFSTSNRVTKLTISGPYGEFFIKESDAEMVYIGGGAGMAPLRSHIFELFKNQKTDRKVSYWYGGRSLRELVLHRSLP